MSVAKGVGKGVGGKGVVRANVGGRACIVLGGHW